MLSLTGYEFPGNSKMTNCGIHFDMTHSGGQRSVIVRIVKVRMIIEYLVTILESHADQEGVLYHQARY
mgnify:CR=1 FL=1